MMRFLITLLIVVVSDNALAYTPPHIFRSGARHGSAYDDSLKMHQDLQAQHGIVTNHTVNYFPQFISHTDPTLGTFLQRYWVDLAYWSPSSDIGFIYISGEGPASGSVDGFAALMAQEFNAITFNLEHRFYGESMPSPLTDKENLRHLTVDNALDDLINFMNFSEKNIALKPLRWVSIGGSYAGALSAWLKVKYPDRVAVAWSSSGVVHTKFDFTEFDGHFKKVLPQSCFDKTKLVMDTFSSMYDNVATRDQLLQMFQIPSYFTKGDMAYMLADGISMITQYGGKTTWCQSITDSAPDQVMQTTFIALGNAYGPQFTGSCTYSSVCLSNITMSDQWAAAGYSWVFQCCSQLAYWQVSYPNSLRPQVLSSDYFMDVCMSAFWPDIFPDTFQFNAKFGGARPPASHVIALQGSDDPWITIGVQKSINPQYLEFTAECDNCGHCGDLAFPSPLDPPNLKKQRDFIRQTLHLWLSK